MRVAVANSSIASSEKVVLQTHPGMALLLKAFVYAESLGRSVWDFAVEIDALQEAGLMRPDLRWLLCQGYVEHAVETTAPGRSTRCFGAMGGLNFTRKDCFALTAEGARLVQAVYAPPSVPQGAAQNWSQLPVLQNLTQPLVPRWDSTCRELLFGGHVVKRFRQPALSQETILAAFEEEAWPPRMDDPLPPQHQLEPKRRLHE